MLSSLGVLGGVASLGIVHHYMQDLPDFSQLENYQPPVVTRLHADDGRIMSEFAIENRVFVPIEAIPQHVIDAFVAAEDQNFYEHPGVDWQGVARAMVANIGHIVEGRRLEGASTITQQVAKNFLLTNDVSISRKIREALLALRIEQAFSKEEILELYLNQIYLGRGTYGVASAALAYFNRPLVELTLAQAAYLAALPRAPNNYNPVTQTEAAIARRGYVLGRMLEDGYIAQEEFDVAVDEPLLVAERRTEFVRAPYFSEEVRRQLQRLYGDEQLYEGGLTVHTTMDPRLQEIAQEALRNGLEEYDRRHGYRGPIAVMEDFNDWAAQLNEMELPAGAHDDWELAVVLEVAEDNASQAILGLPGQRRGVLNFDSVSWAAPWREGQLVGNQPNSVDDVVSLGDIILVSRVGAPPAEVNVLFEGEELAESESPPAADLWALEQVPDVQGALIAMDPHTGHVLAMVGGYDFALSEFNRATQAARQPGSAIKPFVYLAALNQGYTPSTIILDIPMAIEQVGQADYRPQNYGGDQLGPQPLRVGVERSRNLMTVRILQEIGIEPVRDVTRAFGIYEDMPLLYSMALGAGEVTPLRLTAAYGMIANGGRQIEPTLIDFIEDRHGEVIYRHDERECLPCVTQAGWQEGMEAPILEDSRPLVTDPVSVYQLQTMLRGVVQRGTGASLASLGLPLGGKTGTTNDSYDAWFVGFSPNLVAGVYVGFDTPRTLGPRETGGAAAVPIFGEFMSRALEGTDPIDFPVPPGVEFVAVDAATGLRAVDGDRAIMQPFAAGTAPTETTAEALGGPTTVGGDTVRQSTQGTGGLY